MARPRVVIVGAGFAGFHAARELSRIARGRADIMLINPTDYFLYRPLLPEVAAGPLEPRDITVSLASSVPDARLVLGEATHIDLDARRVHVSDPEGRPATVGYHRLVIAVGNTTRLAPVPGSGEIAHGFRGLPEALHLRDHLTQQLELADATNDPFERAARTTFVVAGGGYTGVEVAAHGVVYTDALYQRHPRLWDYRPRWHLIEASDRILPELEARRSATADVVLRQRGVDVRTNTTVEEATATGVRLSDGSIIETRCLIWCVAARPDPLVADLNLPTHRNRILVDEYLNVPGWPGVFACGDAAAVPDLSGRSELTPMSAQNAIHQGRVAARNIAASYGTGRARPYRRRDLSFALDLGGTKAAAYPLRIPLAGLPAKAVARSYHLAALPGHRMRTLAEWLLDLVFPRHTVQTGLAGSPAVPLETERPK